MRWWMLCFVVGCGQDSAELQSRSKALSEWRDGVELLAEGDTKSAQQRFFQARSFRPDDQVLVLWEAEAFAQDGRLDDAVSLLSTTIGESGGGVMPEIYHNRVAYMARAGRKNQAVVAIADGVRKAQINSDLVINDEDFAELLREGSLDFLPRSRLEVSTRVSHQPVLPNESFTVEYQLNNLPNSLASTPLSVRSDGVSGVTVTKIIEEQSGSTTILRFHLIAGDSGVADLGSVQLSVGNKQQIMSPVRVEIKGGVEHVPPIAQPVEWVTPTSAESLLIGGSAWITETLVVELQREEEAQITTPAGIVTPVYRGELRRAGSTVSRCAVFESEALRSLDAIVIEIRNRQGETRRVVAATKH